MWRFNWQNNKIHICYVANQNSTNISIHSILFTFENILNDEVTLSYHNQQHNMCPSKKTELFDIIFFDKTQNEPDKSNTIKAEWKESMISNKHP